MRRRAFLLLAVGVGLLAVGLLSRPGLILAGGTSTSPNTGYDLT